MNEISPPQQITLRAAKISFAVSLVVLAIKFFAYELTSSTGVLSDAVESIVNVLAAFVALFVLKVVAEPADKEHPYGHGKLEFFSAAFEGGMITIAALAIGVEAIKAFIEQREPRQADVGLIIMCIAGVFNLILGLYLKTIGQRNHSETLKASGAHVISDVWTTVAVVGGLGLVALTGKAWLDQLVGFLMALQLGYSGVRIVHGSIGGLLDQQDPGVLREMVNAFNINKKPWVVDIHQLKMIRSGSFHHIDVHLVVPEYINVAQAHEDCHGFEAAVVSSYPFDGEVAFHLDPCGKKYCRRCEMKECVIRVEEFKEKNIFTPDSCVGGPNQ